MIVLYLQNTNRFAAVFDFAQTALESWLTLLPFKK